VTAQKPTVVTHSVTGNFTGPDQHNLVLARSTQIEVYTISPEGLVYEYDVPINGRISTLKMFRPIGADQDHLFVCTERCMFCVLKYNAERNEFDSVTTGSIKHNIGRATETGQIGIIDPSCSMIGMHLYDGIFQVIPFKHNHGIPSALHSEAYDIRIEELQIIDICFLYQTDEPTIMVLYQDPKFNRHVKTYKVCQRSKELQPGPFSTIHVEPQSQWVVPVQTGGALVVGQEQLVFYGGGDPIRTEIRPTQMTAWGTIDRDRFLFGDLSGNLYVAVLRHDGTRVQGLALEQVGRTSIAHNITYLDNGHVFIGSVYGDSAHVKLNAEPDANGSYVEEVECFANMGSIVDFCVVDLDRQGQCKVVTCSGAYQDGSLRVIHNGVGVAEEACIDLPGIQGVWALAGPNSAEQKEGGEGGGGGGGEVGPHHWLVQTFVSETRVLAVVEEAELQEVDIPGFDHTTYSVHCANVAHQQLVQVTPGGVRLVDLHTQALVAVWEPANTDTKVSVAHACGQSVLLALGGGTRQAVLLRVGVGQLAVAHQADEQTQAACVALMSPVLSAEAAAGGAGGGGGGHRCSQLPHHQVRRSSLCSSQWSVY